MSPILSLLSKVSHPDYLPSRTEMNVGIIAACLPTLKPIAASFLGTVSALTSSNRYASRHPTTGPSRPNASNGYIRQAERSGTRSYAMKDLNCSNEGSLNSSAIDKEYLESGVAHTTHIGRVSCAAGSEDSILPAQKGIMRTVEVEVSWFWCVMVTSHFRLRLWRPRYWTLMKKFEETPNQL